MTALRPTRAVVDLDALAGNYRALGTGLPPGCAVLPVVKADAYGHGAIHVARRLAEEGAGMFAVAAIEEGLELKKAGLSQPVLVMGWIGKDQLEEAVKAGLTLNVHSVEQAEELEDFLEGEEGIAALRAAAGGGGAAPPPPPPAPPHPPRGGGAGGAGGAPPPPLPVHLKLDTGMTRLGLRPEELPRALDLLAPLEGRVVVEGVFQNFATAYEVNASQNADQSKIFLEGLERVRAAGFRPSMIHMDNSGGTLARLAKLPSKKTSSSAVTHVRPGLALYARVPEVGLSSAGALHDVMSFVTAVDQVKTVPPGTKVGYAGTFVCKRPTTLAVLAAGYADGVRRSLSNKGHVLVGGRRCPIAGRISMDLTEVDVTDLPSAPARGDEAVFFGAQGEARITVDEFAAAADTVAWEALCGIGPRVPRIIVQGGRTVARVSKFA